jgi:hypothetical protein
MNGVPGVLQLRRPDQLEAGCNDFRKRPAGVDNSEILLPEIVLKLLVKNRRRGI